jgi:hypothetical protein
VPQTAQSAKVECGGAEFLLPAVCNGVSDAVGQSDGGLAVWHLATIQKKLADAGL